MPDSTAQILKDLDAIPVIPRMEALETISVHGIAVSEEALLKCARDRRFLIRVTLAQELQWINVANKESLLVSLLDDRNPLVRGEAAGSLARVTLHPRETAERLRGLLAHEQASAARTRFAEALFHLTEDWTYIDVMVSTFRSRSLNVRCSTANGLADHIRPATADRLYPVFCNALEEELRRSDPMAPTMAAYTMMAVMTEFVPWIDEAFTKIESLYWASLRVDEAEESSRSPYYSDRLRWYLAKALARKGEIKPAEELLFSSPLKVAIYPSDPRLDGGFADEPLVTPDPARISKVLRIWRDEAAADLLASPPPIENAEPAAG